MREILDLAKTYLSVILAVCGAIAICAFVSIAFAQDAASLPADLTTQDAVADLLKSVGGMKGVSALGIAALAVQAVMLFFRTPLAAFAGKFRLLVVAGLSIAFGVLSLKVSGLDWLGSFVHANTLAAVQVFGSQVVKQIGKTS